MPTYEYRCPECGARQEVVLPFSQATEMQICVNCGKHTRRVFSIPYPAAIPYTGRDKVLSALNKEKGGYSLPGDLRHRERYEQAMSKGLDQTKSVIGRGF